MVEQKEVCQSPVFLNSVQDSLEGILSTWSENVWLASNGEELELIGERLGQ